jgi:outer membrane protein
LPNQYEIAPYDFQDEELLLSVETFDNVLKTSLEYAPGIKRAQADLKTSSYDLKMAKAEFLPRISLSGTYGSNYSSNGARNPETGALVEDAGFFDQIDFNKFKYVNFSMNIPIFGNWRNRNLT